MFFLYDLGWTFFVFHLERMLPVLNREFFGLIFLRIWILLGESELQLSWMLLDFLRGLLVFFAFCL